MARTALSLLAAALLLALQLPAALAGARRWGPYVALCLPVKAEYQYIREFLMHHQCAGIDRVYMFDHMSSPPMNFDVQDFIQDGFVHYHYFTDAHWLGVPSSRPGREGPYHANAQDYVDDKCLEFAQRDGVTWLGYWDVDEFLVLRGKEFEKGIGKFMEQYEEFGGLQIMRIFVGSDGHKTTPPGKVTESYMKCIIDEHEDAEYRGVWTRRQYTKAIISVEDAKYSTVHGAVYWNGKFPVDENKKPLEPTIRKDINLARDKIGLLHYWSKSLEEFTMKKAKGDIYYGPGNRDWLGLGEMEDTDLASIDDCTPLIKPYLDTCYNNGRDWRPIPHPHIGRSGPTHP